MSLQDKQEIENKITELTNKQIPLMTKIGNFEKVMTATKSELDRLNQDITKDEKELMGDDKNAGSLYQAKNETLPYAVQLFNDGYAQIRQWTNTDFRGAKDPSSRKEEENNKLYKIIKPSFFTPFKRLGSFLKNLTQRTPEPQPEQQDVEIVEHQQELEPGHQQQLEPGQKLAHQQQLEPGQQQELEPGQELAPHQQPGAGKGDVTPGQDSGLGQGFYGNPDKNEELVTIGGSESKDVEDIDIVLDEDIGNQLEGRPDEKDGELSLEIDKKGDGEDSQEFEVQGLDEDVFTPGGDTPQGLAHYFANIGKGTVPPEMLGSQGQNFIAKSKRL